MSIRKYRLTSGAVRYAAYPYISGAQRYAGTFETLKEAKLAEAEALKRAKTLKRRGVTLEQYREVWLADIHRERSTKQDYKTSILRCEDVLGKDTPLTAIDQAAMNRLVRELMADYAPSTIRKTVKDLRALLSSAHMRGLAPEPPKPESLPKVREKRPTILTAGQVELVIEKADPYWRPLFLLAATSGMRRNELLGLTWDDLDLDAGVVHVRQQVRDGELKPLKTDAAVRDIHIPQRTIVALRAHESPPNALNLVFPSQRGKLASPTHVSRRVVREVFDSCDLPKGEGLHLLRHTYASVLIASGASAKVLQVMLGHEDVTTTMNVYGHLFPEAWEQAASAVGAWLDKSARQETSSK